MIKDEEKTGDGYGHSNLLTPSFSEEGFQKGPRRRGRILKPLERGGMDVMGTLPVSIIRLDWNLGSRTGSVKGGRPAFAEAASRRQV